MFSINIFALLIRSSNLNIYTISSFFHKIIEIELLYLTFFLEGFIRIIK